jgi:hypothetical protein
MAPSLLTALLLAGVPGGDEPPAPEDAFRAALIAAVHGFAAEGKLDHLQAVLDRYPKLVNARQVFRQPHKPGRTDGFTPLHHAAERGREEVVGCLLARGADVNSADGMGWTPLHLAARAGHLAVVKELVRHGAKVDAKTVAVPESTGFAPGSPPGARPQKFAAIPSLTPLDLAREGQHSDVVEYLRSAGK